MNFTTEVFTGSATVFIFRNKIPRTLLFFFLRFCFFLLFLAFSKILCRVWCTNQAGSSRMVSVSHHRQAIVSPVLCSILLWTFQLL